MRKKNIYYFQNQYLWSIRKENHPSEQIAQKEEKLSQLTNPHFVIYELQETEQMVKFQSFIEDHIDDLESITDYYIKTLLLIRELHDHQIVIPSLFSNLNHLYIQQDTDEVYIANLIQAQVEDLPAAHTDPILQLLQKKHLPNFYFKQDLYYPNIDFITLLSSYFLNCTSCNLLNSFYIENANPNIIPIFFNFAGLQQLTFFQNEVFLLFSDQRVHILDTEDYLYEIMDHYDLIEHPHYSDLFRFIEKDKMLSKH